jgi:hypothetical protein
MFTMKWILGSHLIGDNPSFPTAVKGEATSTSSSLLFIKNLIRSPSTDSNKASTLNKSYSPLMDYVLYVVVTRQKK